MTLDDLPGANLIAGALDAHTRRRKLVLEICALSDKTTAIVALWLARAASIRGGTVEEGLRAFKAALLR